MHIAEMNYDVTQTYWHPNLFVKLTGCNTCGDANEHGTLAKYRVMMSFNILLKFSNKY